MTLHRPQRFDVVGTGFTVLDLLYADGDFAGEALGGSCGNVLLSLAMLQRHVAPILSLGMDETGRRLVEEFELAGADVRFITRRVGMRSPIVMQQLDTTSGYHSFSFTCRETNSRFPSFQPISDFDVACAESALRGCSIFYTDRLSNSILRAMEVARAANAVIYFEPSVRDDPLFDAALPLTTILKYSSDRLGGEVDRKVASSPVISIVTHGVAGLEIRQRRRSVWCESQPAERVADTCGSGDMVSVGLIDRLLSRGRTARTTEAEDVVEGVVAGQRLASANCAFAGARGLFLHLGAPHARKLLSA